MNYESLKDDIKQITEITNSVPELFRLKCFEILLQNLLSQQTSSQNKSKEAEQPRPPETRVPGSSKLPIPATVKVFMRRTGVTEDDLNAILLYENNDVLFFREPQTTFVGQGQIEWALLLALKKAILSNEFTIDPEDVRSICKEKGFYDASNFAGNFKYPANKVLFKALLKPQGDPQPLSDEGQVALGKLIKTYIGKSQ